MLIKSRLITTVYVPGRRTCTTLQTRYMHVTRTLHARYMHVAITLQSRCMHVTCTLHARYMHVTCMLHARRYHNPDRYENIHVYHRFTLRCILVPSGKIFWIAAAVPIVRFNGEEYNKMGSSEANSVSRAGCRWSASTCVCPSSLRPDVTKLRSYTQKHIYESIYVDPRQSIEPLVLRGLSAGFRYRDTLRFECRRGYSIPDILTPGSGSRSNLNLRLASKELMPGMA
jgi:hypothetical protein